MIFWRDTALWCGRGTLASCASARSARRGRARRRSGGVAAATRRTRTRGTRGKEAGTGARSRAVASNEEDESFVEELTPEEEDELAEFERLEREVAAEVGAA